MKKMSLAMGGLLFLIGCSPTTTKSETTTTQSTTEHTTTTTTTTTTQTAIKKENQESSSINDNLDAFVFDNKSFEIRATRRWLKQESTNGNLLSLVGYRSRANIFFTVAKTTETTLEAVATSSFKDYAAQYAIASTLPLIPLKNTTHPTVKTVYDIKTDTEKHVLILYTVDMNGTYINISAVVSPEIFEEIRQELDTMVNSLMAIKS